MRKVRWKKLSRGVTLIELILTIVIVSIGLLGIMKLFESAGQGAMFADKAVIASGLAREKIERIVQDKSLYGFDYLEQANYPPENLDGDFSMFSRTTQITRVSWNDLVTEDPVSPMKRIEVKVQWGANSGQSVSVATLLTSYSY